MKYKSWAGAAIACLLGCGAWAEHASERPTTFRFAVIGDSGTGKRAQFEVGERIAERFKASPFDTVLMLGDNLYGGESPREFQKQFELPYKPLLDSGVQFHAVLGNHDTAAQTNYAPFHMDGRRYYSFEPQPGIRFFALDSTAMDAVQLKWLEKELADSSDAWKIAFFHHPIYSSGARHGSDLKLRSLLEPLFVKYGVGVALSGHDHFYERLEPQHGVHYFVVGGSAKLRAGNVRPLGLTAKAFDRDESYAFMEIDGDTLRFEVTSRTGEVVDSGSFKRPGGSPVLPAPVAAR